MGTQVNSLTGDAQIVLVRKKPRHGFNFEAELAFRLTVADESFDGTLSLPELGDAIAPEELSMTHTWGDDSAPPGSYRAKAGTWLERLHGRLVEQVITFVAEYQAR